MILRKVKVDWLPCIVLKFLKSSWLIHLSTRGHYVNIQLDYPIDLKLVAEVTRNLLIVSS